MKQSLKSIAFISGFLLLYILFSIGSAKFVSYVKVSYTGTFFLNLYQAFASLFLGIAFGFLIFFLKKHARAKKTMMLCLFFLLFFVSLLPQLFLFLGISSFMFSVFVQFDKLLLAFSGISLTCVFFMRSHKKA